MSATKLEFRARARLRCIGATLFGAVMGVAITASAFAADTVTLRVGGAESDTPTLLVTVNVTM